MEYSPDEFDTEAMYEYFKGISYSDFLSLFSYFICDYKVPTGWKAFLHKHLKRKVLIEKQIYK